MWKTQEMWQDCFFYFTGSAVEGYVALTIDDGPMRGEDLSQNLVEEARNGRCCSALHSFHTYLAVMLH